MDIDFPEKAWQELYRSALFETDKTKTAGRIADAARAIKARARSLFDNPDDTLAERNALDAAFYALSILNRYTPAQKSSANASAPPTWITYRQTQKASQPYRGDS